MKSVIEKIEEVLIDREKLTETLRSLESRLEDLLRERKGWAERLACQKKDEDQKLSTEDLLLGRFELKTPEFLIEKIRELADKAIMFREGIRNVQRELRKTDLRLTSLKREAWDYIFNSLREKFLSEAGEDLRALYAAAYLRNGGCVCNLWHEAFNADLWSNDQGPSTEEIAETKDRLLKRFADSSAREIFYAQR